MTRPGLGGSLANEVSYLARIIHSQEENRQVGDYVQGAQSNLLGFSINAILSWLEDRIPAYFISNMSELDVMRRTT